MYKEDEPFCINGVLFACFECDYNKCCGHPLKEEYMKEEK